jgi:DNA adenine methylase
MPEPYSPLRYPGGKAKLANFLISVLSANGLRQPNYIEPYAGGAGAALRLLAEEYVSTITINDADPRISCFWQAITRRNDVFVDMLENTPATLDEWHRQRQIYEKRDLRKILDLGFATFFLNRTSRSGIVHNAGPIGGYDQRGNYQIDARYNRDELRRRIQRIGSFSDRIFVSCKDGLGLLKNINRSRLKASRSFVYIDPPYYAKGSELYLNQFTSAQHSELAEYLGQRLNFPWIMTYDNVPQIRRLYKGLSRLRFNLSYSAYERRQGEELLIYPKYVTVPHKAVAALPAMAS